MILLPMLLVTLSAPGVEVTVTPEHGGEMSSLRLLHKGHWVETLYLANDYSPRQGWTGKAPWLWPATGQNPPLPAHGFARDLPWKLESHSPTRATLSLADTPDTRKMYPYGFRLQAAYEARPGGKVRIHYVVTAAKSNTGPMPFSAGNHITFKTPLLPGADPLAMTFESPSGIEHMKKDGIPTGVSRPRSFASPARLGDIERLSAVSLSGYKPGQPAWMILRDPGGMALRISHRASSVPADPVVRFNVWGDPAAGYFSPEPWVGLQNAHNSGKGLTHLAPGARWEWWIDIDYLPHSAGALSQ